MITVAALYVDMRGPYPAMGGVDCWDESRDAREYDGPHPIVAHPPCGPWGRLKFLCTKQDPECGLRAVEQVWAFGGVLEHPEHSSLFRHCGLPVAGESDGIGRTYRVEQSGWGHRCKKATWLYIVGVPRETVEAGIRAPGRVTHRITNGSRGDTTLPRVGALEARLSPTSFAEWLVSLARASITSSALAAPRMPRT